MGPPSITRLTLLFLVVYIAKAIFQYLSQYMNQITIWNIVNDIRISNINKSDILIIHTLPEVIANILMLVGITVVLLILNWRLSLSILPFLLIIGFRTTQLFIDKQDKVKQNYFHFNKSRYSALYMINMQSSAHIFIELASALGTIVLIYLGGHLILNEMLAIEDLVAFFLYLQLFYRSLYHLNDVWEQKYKALLFPIVKFR